jgi:hypothetical protein
LQVIASTGEILHIDAGVGQSAADGLTNLVVLNHAV